MLFRSVCAAIRKGVGELYGEAVAEATTIQYGGSMNAANADELLSKPDVEDVYKRQTISCTAPKNSPT